MHIGKYVFAQITKFLPQSKFERIVDKIFCRFIMKMSQRATFFLHLHNY